MRLKYPIHIKKYIKLNVKVWLVIFRILWFLGYSKNSESYKTSKQRAQNASKRLIELSKKQNTIVLVGHGVMNKLIGQNLVSNNWKNTKKSKNSNWDYEIFEL